MINFLKGAAIGAIGMYVAGAFVTLNYNVIEWTEAQRLTVFMAAGFGGIASWLASK